jgi:hypothetical protein
VVSRGVLTRGAAALLLALAVYLAWSWLAPSEEDRVRAAIESLSEALSGRASDPLGQVAALGRLRARLAEDVVIEAPRGPIRGRDAVAALWQRIGAGAEAITVRVLDVAVVVAADGSSADTSGVAELTRQRGGVPERELHEVRATFVKIGGDWRLARAAREEAITPPPGEAGRR